MTPTTSSPDRLGQPTSSMRPLLIGVVIGLLIGLAVGAFVPPLLDMKAAGGSPRTAGAASVHRSPERAPPAEDASTAAPSSEANPAAPKKDQPEKAEGATPQPATPKP